MLADKAERCDRCGSLPTDWRDDDGPVEPVWEVQRGICMGCVHVEDALAMAPRGPAGRGAFVRLRRILRR